MKKLKKAVLVVLFGLFANNSMAVDVEFTVNDKKTLIHAWYHKWVENYNVYDVVLPASTEKVKVSMLSLKHTAWSEALFSYDSTSFLDDEHLLYSAYSKLDETIIQRDMGENKMFYKLNNLEGGNAYVRIIFKDDVTSTSEALRDFLTFQNPVTNTLKLNTDFDCDVQIYNQNGQLVNATKTSANSDNRIDFSNHPTGVYFMEVRKGSAVFREKVIKE